MPPSTGKEPDLLRAAFDAVERPVARASRSLMQSDRFMDGFTVTWRVQRRLQTRVRRSLDMWLGLWHLPSRTDVARVSNEIAGLERQVRELRAEVGRPKGGG